MIFFKWVYNFPVISHKSSYLFKESKMGSFGPKTPYGEKLISNVLQNNCMNRKSASKETKI